METRSPEGDTVKLYSIKDRDEANVTLNSMPTIENNSVGMPTDDQIELAAELEAIGSDYEVKKEIYESKGVGKDAFETIVLVLSSREAEEMYKVIATSIITKALDWAYNKYREKPPQARPKNIVIRDANYRPIEKRDIDYK